MLRIGTKTESHLATLGLPFPITSSELTSAFRHHALLTNPDRGGDARKFQAVKDDYEWLKNLAMNDPVDNGHHHQFGMGLDKGVNAKWCDECGGNGYFVNRDSVWFVEQKPIHKSHRIPCHVCKGAGEVRIYNPVIRKGAIKGKR